MGLAEGGREGGREGEEYRYGYRQVSRQVRCTGMLRETDRGRKYKGCIKGIREAVVWLGMDWQRGSRTREMLKEGDRATHRWRYIEMEGSQEVKLLFWFI